MERKWFKGDTHLHTINSDGVLTKGQLVEYCKKQGLNFIIITDRHIRLTHEKITKKLLQNVKKPGQPFH